MRSAQRGCPREPAGSRLPARRPHRHAPRRLQGSASCRCQHSNGACEVARANCVLLVHQAVERGEGQPVQRAAVASAPGVSPQGRLAPQPGRGSPPSKPAGGCTVPATARRLYFRDPLRPVRSSLARQPVRRERGLLAGSVCPSGTPTRRYLLRCQWRWLPSCSSPATHVGGYFR